MGMFNLASLLAPRIAQAIDLSGCRRLLDLGGGPGTYAIHFCLANPGLSAVVYDLPTTRSFAEETIARFDLSGGSPSLPVITMPTRFPPALMRPGCPMSSMPTVPRPVPHFCARRSRHSIRAVS